MKLAFAPAAPARKTYAVQRPSRPAFRTRSIESTLYAIVLGGLFLLGAASFAQAFETLRESDAIASHVAAAQPHGTRVEACPVM
jgi:hypothetical protein